MLCQFYALPKCYQFCKVCAPVHKEMSINTCVQWIRALCSPQEFLHTNRLKHLLQARLPCRTSVDTRTHSKILEEAAPIDVMAANERTNFGMRHQNIICAQVQYSFRNSMLAQLVKSFSSECSV